jgi:hypothetical protein
LKWLRYLTFMTAISQLHCHKRRNDHLEICGWYYWLHGLSLCSEWVDC